MILLRFALLRVYDLPAAVPDDFTSAPLWLHRWIDARNPYLLFKEIPPVTALDAVLRRAVLCDPTVSVAFCLLWWDAPPASLQNGIRWSPNDLYERSLGDPGTVFEAFDTALTDAFSLENLPVNLRRTILGPIAWVVDGLVVSEGVSKNVFEGAAPSESVEVGRNHLVIVSTVNVSSDDLAPFGAYVMLGVFLVQVRHLVGRQVGAIRDLALGYRRSSDPKNVLADAVQIEQDMLVTRAVLSPIPFS
jgi:hypothetical protein